MGKIPDDREMRVVPLDKALYGHPESGVHWEEKCNRAIKLLGFQQVGTCGEWRSCFYHPEQKLFLMVYVDDFKMAGPKDAVEAMWKRLNDLGGDDSLELGAAQPLGHVSRMSA